MNPLIFKTIIIQVNTTISSIDDHIFESLNLKKIIQIFQKLLSFSLQLKWARFPTTKNTFKCFKMLCRLHFSSTAEPYTCNTKEHIRTHTNADRLKWYSKNEEW